METREFCCSNEASRTKTGPEYITPYRIVPPNVLRRNEIFRAGTALCKETNSSLSLYWPNSVQTVWDTVYGIPRLCTYPYHTGHIEEPYGECTH